MRISASRSRGEVNYKTIVGLIFLAIVAWRVYDRTIGTHVPAPADWPTHNVSALNCTVRAPWDLDNADGQGSAPGVTYRGTTRGGRSKIFAVMMLPLPPEARTAEYAGLAARENSAARKMSNYRIEPCTVNGFEGSIVKGTDKNGYRSTAAYLLVNDRLYVAACVLPNGSASHALADAFIQSFDVPGARREPEIAAAPTPAQRPVEPVPSADRPQPPPIARRPPPPSAPPPAPSSPPAPVTAPPPPPPSAEQIIRETTDPQELLKALKDQNQITRHAALRRLRELKPTEPDAAVAEGLMSLMSQSRQYVDEAGAALPHWLTKAQAPAVLQRAQSLSGLQTAHERAMLLAAAAKFPGPQVNRAIFDAVGDFHVRTQLVSALAHVGEPAEMVGIAACNHRDPEIRKFGVDVLSEVGGQRGLAVLQARSRDPDFHVKSSAKRAADKVRQRLLDREAQ